MLKGLKKILLTLLIVITLGFTSNVYALYNAVVSSNQANPGEVLASKTAKVVEGSDGRSVDISFNVNGQSFNQSIQSEREIVLVLDDSGSMGEYVFSSTKLQVLKEAASELIDSLLSDNNNGKIKVGIVYYGTNVKGSCALTTNKQELINCLNSMNANGGTNVQEALKVANSLFTNSNSSKNVVLLSDGIPTYYTDSTYGVVGTGNSDDVACLEGFLRCSKYGMRPSEAAKIEANNIKNITNATMYTVGFGIESGDAAEVFLREVASDSDNYYSALTIDALKASFEAIINRIDVVATDVKVEDVIPDKFSIDSEYFITNFGEAITLEDGSVKYGDSVVVKLNDDGTTTVTWLIENLNSTSPNDLTFRVRAKEDYYGNMFTNKGAKVTGVAVDGNPFYEESNAIEISLADPTVVIPAVTVNDSYQVNQGEVLTVNKALGLRNNDYKLVQNDKDAKVVDEVLVVTGVSCGTLSVNKDGSFNYTAPTDYYGNVEFTYYIKTTVEVDGEVFEVSSNVSTVTIAVNRIATNYEVLHYIKGTNTLLDSESYSGYVYDNVTVNAKDFDNYQLVGSESSKTITLKNDKNQVIFYYELKDASDVVVHYYIEGTTTKLSDDLVLSGKLTEKYNTSSLEFDNYELVEMPSNSNGEFSSDRQEVIYYYKLKQGGKVSVYYFEVDTNNQLADGIVLEGKVTEKYETESLDIANWRLVKIVNNVSGEFTLDDQVVIYYYEKVMGKVIVKYVDEDGNVLSKEVVLKGQTSTDYETEALELDGFSLVRVDGEETGKYSDEDIIVTYVYKLVDNSIGEIIVDNEVKDAFIDTGVTANNSSFVMLMIGLLLTVTLVVFRKKINL